MSDIPNAKDLLSAKAAQDPFQSKEWEETKKVATENFKSKAHLLGQGPIDCVEIYRLKTGNTEQGTKHKNLFESMFGPKGYDIRTAYYADVFTGGMSASVTNQQFAFFACTPQLGKN